VDAATQITRSQADGDVVRGRILDAAQEVFAARGYAGASTREIATRAGIGKRMLFYYFPSKDAVYHAVLERIVLGLAAVHERFREEPGPIGLGDAAAAITQVAAANLPAVKVWMREIMDGGPYLEGLAREHLAPLFARSSEEVARNMRHGVFRSGDPMHVLVNVGGITLFYFLILPLLELVWGRDPLEAATVAERAAEARVFLMQGLAGSAGGEGGTS
jgi:TetR/AcrR family transcriptional regulator